MALTYPIEQPYRLKYINPIFYIGSIILLILLVPLNVILGGYDTITIWLADPKTESYEPWWAPKSLPEALRIRTKPGECQGARLDKNNPLRTNSPLPLFSYVLSSDFNQSASLNENGVRTETSYMANPLNGCHITNMSTTLEPKMLFIKVDATVFCDPMGDPPHSRQFVTSFTRTPNDRYRPDSIVRYMEYTRPENKYGRISRGGPPQDTYLNVLGVLDTLSRDLVRMIEIRKLVWGYDEQPRSRPDLEFVQWEVVNNSLDPDLTRLSFIPAVGSMGQGEPYLNYMRQATMNVFVIVRDAIR
ncbi:hypothetical protein RhiJN_12651 [Ceratobasidium sp. AG-Ba]|nr:hypothetical protein RhiJN_12651 [Ceratobasidium sp. AG-Ba]